MGNLKDALANMTQAVAVFEQTLGAKHPVTQQHRAILDQFRTGRPFRTSNSAAAKASTTTTTSTEDDGYPQWMSFLALFLAIVITIIYFMR
jgi:hypothetical protein